MQWGPSGKDHADLARAPLVNPALHYHLTPASVPLSLSLSVCLSLYVCASSYHDFNLQVKIKFTPN
jgi:hypothetical protein